MKTKYRGANLYEMPKGEDISSLVFYGANLIRVQILVWDRSEGEEWKKGVRAYLDHFDNVISLYFTNKQQAVLDIHWAPGPDRSIGTRPDLQRTLAEMWGEIALRYKDNPKVYMYGILNEPWGTASQIQSIMDQCCTAIRAVDSKKMIAITCKSSSPDGFKTLKKSIFKNIHYEVHMYKPASLTLQGFYEYKPGATYPTKTLNKNTLRKWLQPVIDFQKKNKALIYLGEFGVSSTADSATRVAYMKDLIDIAEENAWQWTAFCWGRVDELKGFNLITPECVKLLGSYWNKNI